MCLLFAAGKVEYRCTGSLSENTETEPDRKFASEPKLGAKRGEKALQSCRDTLILQRCDPVLI